MSSMSQSQIDNLVKSTLDKYNLSKYYSGYKKAQANSSKKVKSSASNSSNTSSKKNQPIYYNAHKQIKTGNIGKTISGKEFNIYDLNKANIQGDIGALKDMGVSLTPVDASEAIKKVEKDILQYGDINQIKRQLNLNPPSIELPEQVGVPKLNSKVLSDLVSKINTQKFDSKLSVDSLSNPTQQITLPSSTVVNPTFEPIDVDALVGQYKNLFTPSEEEQKLKEQQDILAALTGKADTIEQRRAELEQEAGIDQKRQTLQSLVNQLNALNTSAQTGQILAEERLAPMQAIEGEKMSIERQRAIKALSLKAMIDATQGDIATALDAVDRAIQAEFKPVEAEIAQKKLEIQALQDQINREDSRVSNSVKLALQEKERLLNKQEKQLQEWKQMRKDISLLALNAARNGADPFILQQIQNAKSVEEAIGYGGTYVLDPQEIERLKSERLKQLSMMQDMLLAEFNANLKAQQVANAIKLDLAKLGLDEYRANLVATELQNKVLNDAFRNQLAGMETESQIKEREARTQAILEGIGIDKQKAAAYAKEVASKISKNYAQAESYQTDNVTTDYQTYTPGANTQDNVTTDYQTYTPGANTQDIVTPEMVRQKIEEKKFKWYNPLTWF